MAALVVVEGVCRFCGCTDHSACKDGCWWLDEGRTVCSSKACVDAYFKEHREIFDRLAMAIRGELACR